MAHFLVVARDASDAEALGRRQLARADHIERIRPFVDSGALVFAAAFVDATGRPTGSVFSMEAASREHLDAWIADDPYTSGGVWTEVDIREIRIGVRDRAITP